MDSHVHILETDRLVLRRLGVEDAAFILALVNDPDWLRFIGDRGVRTHEAARAYLLHGPIDMYARLGFGLYGVELKETGTLIGICGFARRDFLEDVDIGFAFLPAYRRMGYAYEVASATLRYGRERLGLDRIVALVSPGNTSSIRLLEKLGLRFERMVQPAAGGAEICLFAPGKTDRLPEQPG